MSNLKEDKTCEEIMSKCKYVKFIDCKFLTFMKYS